MPLPRLLICDDASLARSIARLVGNEYEVTITADPASAVERLKAEPFDLVLTEVWWKGASNFDVVEAAPESGPHTRVLILTGSPHVADAVRAMRVGAVDFLIKPEFPDALRDALRRALRGEPAQRLRDDFEILWAKRHFERDLEKVLASHPFPAPFALLLLDCDRLKALNTALGHWGADDVLKGMFKILRDEVAPHQAYRLGGDEAGAILPGVALDAAGDLAEKIRSKVEAQFKSTSLEGGHTPTVSIGVGVVQSRPPARSFAEEVDKILARAKQDKNRVEEQALDLLG
jgi:diguanylate cyclase (GGDEF)-like protein